MTACDKVTLIKARKWCVSEYNKRNANHDEHPSHVAQDILEEAEAKFSLGTYGVEGWCDDVGASGVQYCNTGDPYELTLGVETSRYSCRFWIGCWGDYAEQENAEQESD